MPVVVGFVVGLMMQPTLAFANHNNGNPYAHTHLRVTWNGNQYIPFRTSSAGCSDANFVARLQDEIANPNNIAGGYGWHHYTDANLIYDGVLTNTPYIGCHPNTDLHGHQHQVLLSCQGPMNGLCAPFWGPQAGAHRVFSAHSGHDYILETSYVVLDPTEPWWSATGDPPNPMWHCPTGYPAPTCGYYDLWSVFTHELGHMIGDEHFDETDPECPDTNSPVLRSSMCDVPQSTNNSIDNAQRNPDHADDIAAINEAY